MVSWLSTPFLSQKIGSCGRYGPNSGLLAVRGHPSLASVFDQPLVGQRHPTGPVRVPVHPHQALALLVGQAVPRSWLAPGKYCGIEKTATWFGPVSVLYTGGDREILCQLKGPTRNCPKEIRLAAISSLSATGSSSFPSVVT